jgi:glutaredoxin
MENQRLESLPERVEVEVDGEGVYYVTFDADGEKHPADDIGDIPLAERGAVGVHVTGEMPEEMVGRRVYSTGLFGADPGERVRADLVDFGTLRNLSQAGSRGGREAASVYSTSRRLTDAPPSTDDTGETDSTASNTSGVETVGGDSQAGRSGGSEELVIESADDLKTAGGGEKGGNLIEVDRGSAESVPGRRAPAEQEQEGYYPVVVYGADWCKVCRKAKRWLDTREVSYQWRDIEESEEAKEEMNRFCRQKDIKPDAIPTIRIIQEDKVGADKVLQGWSADTFMRMAER